MHTRGGGYSPDVANPSPPRRKPLHADTALRDAAVLHYSPLVLLFTPFTQFMLFIELERAHSTHD